MTRSDGIAIVGMAALPGAANLEQFWDNLRGGVESISLLQRRGAARRRRRPGAPAQHPRYVRARGVLEDAELFDAAFFGSARARPS